MNEHMVTIIIPVYNADKYLRKCLESVLCQTYAEFELILVDDGSKDQSGMICDNFASEDTRIRVIHKSNGGVSSARNTGLDLATGDFITFIDSDDSVDKDLLKTFVDQIHDNDLLISGFNYIKSNSVEKRNVEEARQYTSQSLKEDFDFLYANCYINSPFAKFYRRELIGKNRFDDTVLLGEDLLFNLTYLANCKNILLLPYAGYNYNLTNESAATRNFKPQYVNNIFRCYENVKIFKYGQINYNGDAIDETFCTNCINMVQLICYSEFGKADKVSYINQIITNLHFQRVSKIKWSFGLGLKIPLVLAQKQRTKKLLSYFRLKKRITKIIKK